MELVLFFLIFFFGTVIGSFLGVIIDRLPQNKSFVSGRSQCDHCHKQLGILDLIPVFSYFFLRGKCRYCHASLSFFYPAIEIMTGVLFVLVVVTNYELQITNYGFDILYYFFIISVLILIFFIDLKYGIIPFPLVVSATIITFVYFLLTNPSFLLNHVLAGVGALLFFFALFLITRGKGMGFGDVIFSFFMGFLLGLPNIVLGLYIAFLSGAIVALFLIWLKRKKLRGSTVPFGPFLVLGTLISLFWGDQLVSLTINLLQFTIK